MSPDVAPQSFGKYLLDEEIARGGMSRVFLARLRGLGGFEKRLVVKQVLPELARDPRFVSMFVNEAKTLVQMSHPHIAPVYELGVVDGVYFLAMEYVEGATLSEMLKQGPLAPSLCAHVGAEIGDALHYAHTRFAIVHRDVTPRNVIVDAAGHCRLLDFGIAAPASGAEGGELFGTPGYLSPEQLRAESLDGASDVFSLGAVLYEALTGKRAFAGQTVEETREALLSGELPSFEGVPEELGAIVRRAMAPTREARFESARALGRALRGWLASAHPEGIAPELGARAEQALERRVHERRTPAPPSGERRDPSGVVRTLATSRVLDALLEGQEPPATPATAALERASDPPAPSTPATAAIERASDPPAPSEPTTAALVRSDGAGREPHAPSAAKTLEEPRPSSRSWWAPALLAGAASVALAAWIGWPAPEPLRTSDPPRVDARPPPLPPVGPIVGPPAVETTPEVEPQTAKTEPAPPPSVPAVPAPEPSLLTLSAQPWAHVRLDGRDLGNRPIRNLSVRPGVHTLELSCPPLGRSARATIRAERGRPITVLADMTQSPPEIRIR